MYVYSNDVYDDNILTLQEVDIMYVYSNDVYDDNMLTLHYK